MHHPRYSAPAADQIWSDQSRARRMREISDIYAIAAIDDWGPQHSRVKGDFQRAFTDAGPVDVVVWSERENQYGHEIVGFLSAYLDRLPKGVHKYAHYGLTSSDLVEYDLHLAIQMHTSNILGAVGSLHHELTMLSGKHQIRRAGRTHGQIAEITTLDHQLDVFAHTLYRLGEDLQDWTGKPLVKSVGPVGHSNVRENLTGLPHEEECVVRLSTQILPRDELSGWAGDYLRLSNFLESLAMFIRLGCRSEVGEFREGAAAARQGSSAMPGKANPIDSEKVCGLARVVRGYHLALSEVQGAMWEDRDLSNSSTERIAVPGLAATVEHMLDTMIIVIRDLQVNRERIADNALDPRTGANKAQSDIQRRLGVDPIRASEIIKEKINI